MDHDALSTPKIQWYPGHIARAEKTLKEQLKWVDVVLEVRDARIPLATAHPRMTEWAGQRPRVLILNRVDMIPRASRQAWRDWYQRQGQSLHLVNARDGEGVGGLIQAMQGLGAQINQKRSGRGLLPRPVRAVVLGFPNVGKSALINRLLGRRATESARRAGVTRQLRWLRLSDHMELLDTPGVLPARLHDQGAAVRLAICEDIGEAAYENYAIATALVSLLHQSSSQAILGDRYGLECRSSDGELYLEALANKSYQGDLERTACQVLNDFRRGNLGAISLEMPPISP